MSEKQEEQTFEASLKTLEEAVEQLEAGSLPLSDALNLFEQGLKASNVCRARLEDAKQKVEVLVKDHSGFKLEELDDEGVEDDAEDEEIDTEGLPF
ncbi:TPA: exodeoxyribonuclease VII small subunit [Candidatus Latescibacteria bacterium]|nr:exodeoxyribonuclease VII small subunit [Candidatus Latescibacterota bacterium]